MIDDTEIKAKLLNTMADASAAVMELYDGEYAVETKDDKSPVTAADYRANEILTAGIGEFGYPIISEEGGAKSPITNNQLSSTNNQAPITNHQLPITNDQSPIGASHRSSIRKEGGERSRAWIVDPLDGTRDFIEKTGEFCIMVALVEDGRPILGAVAVPAEGVMYWAEKGEGASKFSMFNYQSSKHPLALRALPLKEGEKQLFVSEVKETTEARMVASRSHFSEELADLAEKLGTDKLVKVGSNGIKMGRVAEGAADVFVTNAAKLGEWDLAAPHLILEEAGGKVTDLEGREIRYNKDGPYHTGGVAATNDELHDQVLNFINS